ncbi:MAG: helix-turn-helix domain-containing protein [Rubrobacteraceae bacterium]|nr:helix-turn-helix domain-containing protein [Rubrobacteraceae bacterium]
MKNNSRENLRASKKIQENGVERGWLSPEEAIVYTGIGRTRLYALLASGELPSAKLGRTRHIRRADLDAFLEARMFRR